MKYVKSTLGLYNFTNGICAKAVEDYRELVAITRLPFSPDNEPWDMPRVKNKLSPYELLMAKELVSFMKTTFDYLAVGLDGSSISGIKAMQQVEQDILGKNNRYI